MMGVKCPVFRFSDIEVRQGEMRASRAGKTLVIEPKAFRVLVYLLEHAGHLVSKSELMDAVWGETSVTENSLTRAVALLRRVLEDDPFQPHYIATISTAGYRFIAPVETVEEAGSSSQVPVETEAVTFIPEGISAQRSGRTRWIAAGASVVLLATISALVWHFGRPLPPPRIASFTQITHDGREKSLVGSDGSRLYFTLWSSNAIGQVGINGGNMTTIPLTVPGVLGLSDISFDGTSALIQSEAGMFVAPILGGLARRVGEGHQPSFSPDGTSVIYYTPQGDVLLARIDGTETRKLASLGAAPTGFRPVWDTRAGLFRWSPDGKTIRFDKDGQLREMRRDGSGLRRLLADWKEPGIQCCGMWTADGSLYLFRLYLSPTRSELWALDERRRLFGKKSTAPVRLTTGPIAWRQPVAGRSGNIYVEGATQRGELTRVDPKTGTVQPFLGGISAEYLSWSPDGNSVAWVSFPEGALWKANRDGTDAVELLAGSADQTLMNPRWSPDSKQIAFQTAAPDLHSAIALVSVDGGKVQRLPAPDKGDRNDANWSPDGRRILFGQGAYFVEKRDLRFLDLASGQVSVVPGSDGMWSPRWSPDGRYIMALHGKTGGEVWVLDLETERWSKLQVNGGAGFPSFSHDSRYLYFVRNGPDQGVFRIAVTGGREERVVDMRGWHLTGFYWFSLSLDPADAPVLLRDVGSDDIYALKLEY